MDSSMHESKMISGTPIKVILRFAGPVLFGAFFQQGYTVLNMLIVGRVLGQNSIASIGSASVIFGMIISVISGLVSGYSIIIGQKYGASEHKQLRATISTMLIIGTIASVIISVASLVGTDWLLRLCNTPEDIYAESKNFLIIKFTGIIAVFLFNSFIQIARALGDGRISFITLALFCVINILFDYLLVVVFEMSESGVAIAILSANLLAATFCYIALFNKYSFIRLKKEDWGIDIDVVKKQLSISIPIIGFSIMLTLGNMFMQSALNLIGTEAIAGYTSAVKIEQVFVLSLSSISVAISTYCAHNLGAEKYSRIKIGVKQTFVLTLILSLTVSLILFLFGTQIMKLMYTEVTEYTLSIAELQFKISAFSVPFLSVLFVFRNAMQGMGYMTPLILGGIVEVVARVISVAALKDIDAYLGVGLANASAWFFAAITIFVLYYKFIRNMKDDYNEMY